uniref:Secretion-regulating guanine nucleotide exchange factor-like isoform X1 n=1 Tax=Crassostrea virginica TaxID=6565 RepID=A0A8B8BU41_CRAVI|nr:secretion-regulating guanine nucleotide exchange factor-like isoform X1 [Crassostrea virginica]
MTVHIFSWGANSYGQLGQGNQDDQILPREITFPESSNCSMLSQPVTNRIKSITGGGGHSAIVQDDGQLFTCGSNCAGQLGLNHFDDVAVFTYVNLPTVKVHKVALGWDFTIILADNGEVFVCGSNEYGQLGVNPETLQKPIVPMKVNLPEAYSKVVDIAAGLRHTTIVTAEGKVYCWGMRRKLKDKDLMSKAVKKALEVPILEPRERDKFVKVTAGSFHTLVLTEQGNLWIFGIFKYGVSTQQKCHSTGDSIQIQAIPASWFDGPIVNISSGWTHCIVQSVSGKIYSWGRGNYGQLGRSCDESHDGIPHQIGELHDVTSVVCGSEHNLVITVDGRLFAWGWNEHGMCATGDEKNVERPKEVEIVSEYLSIHCGTGAGHCFLLCHERVK